MLRLFFALGPLIAFYVVESWYGLRPAVAAGMGFALAELLWTRWSEGRWSRMAVFTGLLIGILGGLSLASDDERFVLLSPAIGDIAFAVLIGGFQLRGVNLLRMAMEEQDPELDIHPLQDHYLNGLAWRFAANLLAHAALTAWSAGQSRETWLLVSGPIQYAMMGGQMALEIAWSRFVVLPRVEAAEAAEAAEAHGTGR